jgi:predicted nucleic acid-binding protein
MNGIALVDSDVLIYVYDRDAGPDSEDQNDGQLIAGVRVVNPLR